MQTQAQEHIDCGGGRRMAWGREGRLHSGRDTDSTDSEGKGNEPHFLRLCPTVSFRKSMELLPQKCSGTQRHVQEGSSPKKPQALAVLVLKHVPALGWRLWSHGRMMLPISEGPQHHVVGCQTTNRSRKVSCRPALGHHYVLLILVNHCEPVK